MLHKYSDQGSMRPEIHPDHLDEQSGWLTARYEIMIKRSPQDIWEYVYDPNTWTASNPDEHMGLRFFNQENRPATGTAFHQKEALPVCGPTCAVTFFSASCHTCARGLV